MRPLGWASKATNAGGGDGEPPPEDWEAMERLARKRGRLNEQDKAELAKLSKAKTKALIDDALAGIGQPLTGMSSAMLENECLRLLQGIIADCGSGPSGRGPTREPFPPWPAAADEGIEDFLPGAERSTDEPADSRSLLSRRADPAVATKGGAAAEADPWTGR